MSSNTCLLCEQLGAKKRPGRLGRYAQTCDACEELITKVQFVMEGVSTTGGAGIQFHVMCFQIWDAERLAPGRT